MDGVNWGWGIAGVALAWNIINTVYTWYATTQSVTRREIEKLMGDTTVFGNRLTKIEADMRSMPSAAQFHELDKKVTEVSGAIRTMEAEMKPTAISVKRIEDFLLNGHLAQVLPTRSKR